MGTKIMAELFSPTPEPEHDPSKPRIIPNETKLTRTVATILMFCWAWWWWHEYNDGAYWVIPAVFILATGETFPKYYRLFSPIWMLFKYIVDPLIFLIFKVTRLIIPESYRKPAKVLKPLSFKEINEALDQAAEDHEKRKRDEK